MISRICSFVIVIFFTFSSSVNAGGLIFGVSAHPENFYGSNEEFIETLVKYNIKAVRFDYPWSQMEKNKGIFTPLSDNNKTEYLINNAWRYNIKLMAILDYGNNIYGIDKPQDGYQIGKFSAYCGWVAKHLNHKVEIFEIWNEWTSKNFDKDNINASAANYVNLVGECSSEIRKINRNVIIIAGSYNPMNGVDKSWGRELVKLGIMKYIDGISIHPYAYYDKNITSPDSLIKIIEQTRYELNKINGEENDIYITEIGFPSRFREGMTDEKISFYFSEMYNLINMKPFIKSFIWYDFIDDGVDSNDKEQNFGILKYNLQPKPIAQKFKEKN